jgi:hypothetical protein
MIVFDEAEVDKMIPQEGEQAEMGSFVMFLDDIGVQTQGLFFHVLKVKCMGEAPYR